MIATLDKLRAFRREARECQEVAHAIHLVSWERRSVDYLAQTVAAEAEMLAASLDRLIVEYGAELRGSPVPPTNE
jgi:hypothetical protein